ncbi:MAG: hypothetical protein HY078_00055 [Elusimicrobia bacterium]|nr:hypothetical protein [Elusimicrobiota bacterium]
MTLSPDLKKQIEIAFDFRGHVTVVLDDGTSLEGYLYNRQYATAKRPQDGYVDVILKNKDEKRRVPMDRIRSIAITGEDCAAGKSYADYVAKQKEKGA